MAAPAASEVRFSAERVNSNRSVEVGDGPVYFPFVRPGDAAIVIRLRIEQVNYFDAFIGTALASVSDQAPPANIRVRSLHPTRVHLNGSGEVPDRSIQITVLIMRETLLEILLRGMGGLR